MHPQFIEPEGVEVGVVSLGGSEEHKAAFLQSVQRGNRKLALIRQLHLPEWLVTHIPLPDLEAINNQADELYKTGFTCRVKCDYTLTSTADGVTAISDVSLRIEVPEPVLK